MNLLRWWSQLCSFLSRKEEPEIQVPAPGLTRSALGRRGEEAAARELARRGYKILDRNYRCPVGEIDLVARQGPTLVFVEVKTRTQDRFGAPAEAVGYRKQQKIRRVADFFMAHKREEALCRFDVVSVTMDSGGNTQHIEVIPGAF